MSFVKMWSHIWRRLPHARNQRYTSFTSPITSTFMTLKSPIWLTYPLSGQPCFIKCTLGFTALCHRYYFWVLTYIVWLMCKWREIVCFFYYLRNRINAKKKFVIVTEPLKFCYISAMRLGHTDTVHTGRIRKAKSILIIIYILIIIV